MKLLLILRFVLWRPLVAFTAGAFLSIALMLNGPTDVGILLVSPAIFFVQGLSALVRTQYCDQTPRVSFLNGPSQGTKAITTKK